MECRTLLTAAPQLYATNFTVDATKVGDISGKVFLDANKSGKLDTGEKGLGGATVYLDLKHAGKISSADPMETTDSDGNYSFSNVAVGTAWVGTIPAVGYVAGTTGAEFSSTVTANATSTLNFPEVVLPAPVTLTAPVNQTANVAVSTTFKIGTLTVTSNAKAPYKVTINWGDGSAATVVSVSAAGALPAEAHKYANAGTYTVSITAADSASHTSNKVTFTATILGTASISGTVYNDLNGDGLHTSNEPGLAGVTVEIFNLDNKNALVAKTTTSSTGAYLFKQLAAGDYRVVSMGKLRTVTPTAGYYDLSGSAKLANGKAATGLNFETTNNVLIDGTVFVDLNGNGTVDKGEAVANDTITITSKSSGKVVATLKTNSSGQFSIDSLPAGTYVVTATPSAGAIFSPASSGTATVTLAAAAVHSITFKETKIKQSTNLNGSYTGMVDGNAATLVFSAQTATNIQGTLSVPALFGLKSSGLFTGSIAADGSFTYSRTTSAGTLTITGQESADGMTLTGTVAIPFFGTVPFTFTRTA